MMDKIRMTDVKTREMTDSESFRYKAYDEVYRLAWDDYDLINDMQQRIKLRSTSKKLDIIAKELQEIREQMYDAKTEIEHAITIE